MREFAKQIAALPWALSLYGAKQTLEMLSPQPKAPGQAGTAESLDTVTKAICDQFGDNLKRTFQAGDQIQRQIIDTVFGALGPALSTMPPGSAATSWPQGSATTPWPIFSEKSRSDEEVIVSYTRGQGQFSDDKRFISLNNQIFLLDGRPFGVHQGVWERQFERPEQLLARPDPPSPPLNQPVGPVEKGLVAAQTKAVWAFNDGEIFSVGPAASHLVPLADGSFLFLVSTAQVITHGTGRFQGARGLTQSLGATHVPRGVDLFGAESKPFPATTIDTFKIRRVAQSAAVPGVPAGARSAPATPMSLSAGKPLPSAAPNRAPASNFVDVYGSKMHYVDVGAGDAILFLHGNPTWSYLWRNVIPELETSARCIVPDLIGMGKSDKPAIEYRFFDHAKYLDGFVRALGLKDLTLVMHDWGCILGFFYAMRNESRVKALAFLEATFRPFRTWDDFPRPLRPTFQAFRTPDVGYEKIVVQNQFIEQLLPQTMLRTLSQSEMDMYRLPFREPIHRKVIWRFANELPIAGKPADVTNAVADYGRWLKETRLPKLLLYADPGAITTEKDVRWAKEHLRNLTAVSVGKGLHFLQEDNPEAIGRAIKQWRLSLAKY